MPGTLFLYSTGGNALTTYYVRMVQNFQGGSLINQEALLYCKSFILNVQYNYKLVQVFLDSTVQQVLTMC